MGFQSLQSQMEDFEESVDPLQDWLSGTEAAVQGSSSRLHDLAAKKQELHKLQVLPVTTATPISWLITARDHHRSPPAPPSRLLSISRLV